MKKILSLLFFCLILISTQMRAQDNPSKEDPALASFQMDELVNQMKAADKAWMPVMKGNNVLTGIYRLEAGATDRQRPHDTDEVYYVTEGKAKFKVGEEIVAVKPGSILFVKAEEAHQFFDIEEDLVLLVFFDQ